MNYIKELRDGEMVSEIYLCKNKVVAKTKAGKTYYSLQLQDKTGTVDAKIWELSNAIAHFEPMDYIRVDAQVTSFNGALQLNVKRVRVADEGEYNVTDYMPCSTKDIDTMYQELLGLIQGVKNQYLHKLLEMFFVEDKEFAEKFKKHSAAKSIHHGFIGGLLEHSLSVAKLCEEFALNNGYDMHIAYYIGLFHDIAKYMPKDEMLKWMQSVCPENMEYPVAVWHGFVGAAVTKDIFLIENPIIYNAIYHHVLGTSQDPYAMMVFCADKLDPLRGYDSTKLIEICNKDIKEGFDLVVQQNREYLKRG